MYFQRLVVVYIYSINFKTNLMFLKYLKFLKIKFTETALLLWGSRVRPSFTYIVESLTMSLEIRNFTELKTMFLY